MTYISKQLIAQAAAKVAIKDMDSMVFAYLKCLDKFGVCGADKEATMNELINFLVKAKIMHNFNANKHLIWLTCAIPTALTELFLRDFEPVKNQKIKQHGLD